VTSDAGKPDAPSARVSLRDKQKAMTRGLLWDAAVALFVAKGYSSTTIDDITSAAGVSRATFYLHFDGKARIVAEVYEGVLMPETIEFYSRLDTLTTGPELRAWLDDALGFFERHHDLMLFAEEAVSTEPGLQEFSMAQLLDRCAEAMPRYLGRWPEHARDKASLRLELLILQLSHFARLWVDGHWPVKRDAVLDVLLDLWTYVLREMPRSSS
jgi:AcrR family transcriptional regulator